MELRSSRLGTVTSCPCSLEFPATWRRHLGCEFGCDPLKIWVDTWHSAEGAGAHSGRQSGQDITEGAPSQPRSSSCHCPLCWGSEMMMTPQWETPALTLNVFRQGQMCPRPLEIPWLSLPMVQPGKRNAACRMHMQVIQHRLCYSMASLDSLVNWSFTLTLLICAATSWPYSVTSSMPSSSNYLIVYWLCKGKSVALLNKEGRTCFVRCFSDLVF